MFNHSAEKTRGSAQDGDDGILTCGIDMCIDMRVDMHWGMVRRHDWGKPSSDAAKKSTRHVYVCAGHAVGDADGVASMRLN